MPKINCNYHSRNVRRKDCKNDLNEREYREEDRYNECRLEKEYVKALNATKLDKMNSKPLVDVYNLHNEGICSMENYKNFFVSSCYSNEVLIWDLLNKKVLEKFEIEGNVNKVGICDKNIFVCINRDIFIKNYKIEESNSLKNNYVQEVYNFKYEFTKCNRWTNKKITNFTYDGIVNNRNNVLDINYHKNNLLVATSNEIRLYDCLKETFSYERTKSDGLQNIAINKNMNYLFHGSSFNKTFMVDSRADEMVYDVEIGNSKLKNNVINSSINCMDVKGKNVYLGTEGGFIAYDNRNMEKPIRVFETVAGVRSISCSLEAKDSLKNNKIACGTTDGLIYTFSMQDDKIAYKDMYFNKRMGIVNSVKYSACGNYIVSGSDDGNIRVWKEARNIRRLVNFLILFPILTVVIGWVKHAIARHMVKPSKKKFANVF
ncbi:U3 snoRNP, 18S production [Ecytonucleospora hepatopenaei]|uniref:U3 snoRNP, 18S production n=1 Tax=Ecytonucleospora hepatopenaei TaxID=646526 RepID=A0A1W0E613_9MICR|nr:U3 snoRNP, 18S production [Ecytonucleospora hepatopenaei]